ncbi:type VI secretion system Vgr family protein [Marinobacterium arenosum]|uniref:type VI secretion system Vgr family protein n=1 Tax=Marinobacterium arenosum TaxID=2862496 RepID=UPI001C974E3F|nr:type VI secretion system tip protein TssI/VgrG [Marinobacterium arenosum]MBY4677090.1 type VI secretion system tip protein VgrG [Marinobacterium arenosum]
MGILVDPQSSNLVVSDTKGNSYVLVRLKYWSALSQLAELEADVQCVDVEASSWLGETLTCDVFSTPGTGRSADRSFKGVVTGVQTLLSDDPQRYSVFRLRIQPWLALLAYSRNYRVFQEQSTKEIVTSIFDELGFKGQYKVDDMPSTKREYCLQFNETDLEFVSRLLAEEGVHYHFGVDDESNTLILHDAAKPFATTGKCSLDDCNSPSGNYEVIENWAPRHKFHAATLELAGYDYSQSKLVSSKSKSSKYKLSSNTKLADYRYPAASISGAIDDLAKPLVETQRAQLDSEYHLVDGQTNSAELAVARYLELAAHHDSSQLGDYLVVALEQEFVVEKGNAFGQYCTFTCTPQDHLYYPARLEKPRVYGMQSAVVAGKTDAEPASDAEGRIRIQFHWDTEASGDKTSCYVRVAQSMAGNGYGLQFIPRAGQEVLVSFLDGDPDQPLVTGSLYNSKHKPPYPTADTTQSGIKTQLKGQSNELRFDDKKDNEQLYLHAAKDLLIEVENDADEKVTAEKRIAVTKDISVKGEKNYSLETKENITLTTEKDYSLTATEAISGKGKTIKLEASDSLELVVGGSKLKMTDSKIEIESETISLSGSSKIELDGGDIALSGGSVDLKSSSAMSLKSSSSMSLKATSDLAASGLNAELKGSVGATVKGSATAEINSSGSTTVKGSIVMIN